MKCTCCEKEDGVSGQKIPGKDMLKFPNKLERGTEVFACVDCDSSALRKSGDKGIFKYTVPAE